MTIIAAPAGQACGSGEGRRVGRERHGPLDGEQQSAQWRSDELHRHAADHRQPAVRPLQIVFREGRQQRLRRQRAGESRPDDRPPIPPVHQQAG
jgi:hypothetical protein